MSFDLEMKKLADAKVAKSQRRFFKTGKGEYGEGDIFIGLPASVIQELARKNHKKFGEQDIGKMLKSKIHEERAIALKILVEKYKNAEKNKDQNACRKVFEFYLNSTQGINNWDLVDMSAPYIVGAYLLGRKDRSVLYGLARSNILWERRIAIVSTWMLIRNGQTHDTLRLSEILLQDEHDLMHKAVGWMLREVGKRDMVALKRFIKEHYREIPRTTLRYAIERFPTEKRKAYLNGKLD